MGTDLTNGKSNSSKECFEISGSCMMNLNHMYNQVWMNTHYIKHATRNVIRASKNLNEPGSFQNLTNPNHGSMKNGS